MSYREDIKNNYEIIFKLIENNDKYSEYYTKKHMLNLHTEEYKLKTFKREGRTIESLCKICAMNKAKKDLEKALLI